MRDANLPIQYRDSCANLLIPLNRCRYEEYYLPWKCEVSSSFVELWIEADVRCAADRETQLREVPVRGIQEESREDGRVEGCEGW